MRAAALIMSLLLLATALPSAAQQDFPGGPLDRRSAIVVKDRGGHPQVVVQTVPHLDVTATCLAIRYRTPYQAEPAASLAHLYEHLLFRSAPDRQPGALLLRTEELGSEARAQVGPSLLMLSEMVPSEEGLESLDLQLSRLRKIPNDSSGLAIERRSIGLEIRAAKASPEEQARREILRSFGLSPDIEGDLESLRKVDRESLSAFLEGLNLESDVVITVVGPHTKRQVRQHLAKGLKPLLPKRKEPRPAAKGGEPKAGNRKVTSTSAPQSSYFLRYPGGNSSLAQVTELLLEQSLGPRHGVKVQHEDGDVWRVDVSPPPTSKISLSGETVSKVSLESLQEQLELRWLETWESPLARAEMLAESQLQWANMAGPPSADEMPALVAEAVKLLKAAQEKGVRLDFDSEVVAPKQPNLFTYRRTANRGVDVAEVLRQKLPNGIQVSHQTLESWPIVAISGFFRLKQELSTQQSRALERELESRSGRELDFEVRPGGLFFHTWCQDSDLTATLNEVARVLKELADLDAPLSSLGGESNSKGNVLEQFFIASVKGRSEKLKAKDLINPNNGQLIIVGDIDESQMERGLRPAWSGWFREKKPAKLFPPTTPDKAAPQPESKVVETASGPPLLLIGFAGPTRSNPNFLAFNLAIQTLAGRPTTSLLARQLRDNQRWVDSVRVFPLEGSADPSLGGQSQQTWVIALRLSSAEVDSTKVLEAVRERLQWLAKEGLSEAELRRTRAYLKGRLKLSMATTRGRAQVLAHAEFHRLSESYSKDYAGLYDSIKGPQVKSTCAHYLNKKSSRWLLLKPKAAKTGIPEPSPKKPG